MTKINNFDAWAVLRQKQRKHGDNLPERFVEKPAMKRLLPDLHGKKVLLLGCGTGEESLLVARRGAVDMIGIDISKESIRIAKESYPKTAFAVGDMHKLAFEDASFDFIYSSLVVHYSARPESVYREILRVLKPGGVLQFSVGHPMRWASERIELDGVTTKVLGYSESAAKPRLYGTYSTFKPCTETFPSGESLRFWVASPSTQFKLLRKVGFVVEEFVETQPVAACKKVDQYYYERNHEFPQFCVFVARKV